MRRAAERRLLERTGALVAQLFFIAAGVYLGNRADAWKEERSHQEAARATLTNFRAEIDSNRTHLRTTHALHAELRDSLRAVARLPAPVRTTDELIGHLRWRGLNPSAFRHAAWQVALANQSVTYLDPALAFAIADVYLEQDHLERYGEITLQNVVGSGGMAQENPRPLFAALQAYTVDAATYSEPRILAAYDRLLPRIDSAIARLAR